MTGLSYISRMRFCLLLHNVHTQIQSRRNLFVGHVISSKCSSWPHRLSEEAYPKDPRLPLHLCETVACAVSICPPSPPYYVLTAMLSI